MTDPAGVRVAVPGSHIGSRAEYAARILERLAEEAEPGERLGTKVDLRARCDVSVGTFNEAVKLAQSRGCIVSRSGPGGGIFAAERSPIVRLGNSVLALDPLLVEDALWHSSAVDIREMRSCLDDMAAARDAGDPVAFVRANWALHRRIAEVSPSAILRSVYISLLELIDTHTRGVGGTETAPLPDYVAARYLLHEHLVDAIERREHAEAQRLIQQHNNTEAAR
jgi:DNA-binding FadR family transcriptional regulator